MPTSTVTVKGQTTIPKAIRNYLKLKPKDTLMYIPDGERVVIKPLRGSLLDLKGILKPYHKGGPIDFKKLREQTKRIVARKILDEMP
jgi:AbrB family looped-hinge helix DNA binding protein